MSYWTAIAIIKQAQGELGLPQSPTVVGSTEVAAIQFLALLNACGNELLTTYPWAQFIKTQTFDTVNGQDKYPMPADWLYYLDQTQWDRTNHWPLLGPKSAQEWSWLKNSTFAPAPRLRYRVFADNLHIHPVPGTSPYTLSMEYVIKNWVLGNSGGIPTPADMVATDSDEVLYNPWLVVKFLKLKFYELKGLEATGVRTDFVRMFETLTGKDKGAPTLSLVTQPTPALIGPWSVPDGSWNATP